MATKNVTPPRRGISKARLYKEVEKQASEYGLVDNSGVTLAEFIERLGQDVITEATK